MDHRGPEGSLRGRSQRRLREAGRVLLPQGHGRRHRRVAAARLERAQRPAHARPRGPRDRGLDREVPRHGRHPVHQRAVHGRPRPCRDTDATGCRRDLRRYSGGPGSVRRGADGRLREGLRRGGRVVGRRGLAPRRLDHVPGQPARVLQDVAAARPRGVGVRQRALPRALSGQQPRADPDHPAGGLPRGTHRPAGAHRRAEARHGGQDGGILLAGALHAGPADLRAPEPHAEVRQPEGA